MNKLISVLKKTGTILGAADEGNFRYCYLHAVQQICIECGHEQHSIWPTAAENMPVAAAWNHTMVCSNCGEKTAHECTLYMGKFGE